MRNHTSKRFAALCLTAVALVVLTGCSADSPTAPKSPTPTPKAAGISLAAVPTQFYFGDQVQLTATLSGGAQAVPDGTSVTFRVADQTAGVTCNLGDASVPVVAFENGDIQVTKTTTGGVARTFLQARECAPAGIQFEVAAVVPNDSDDVTLFFLGLAAPTPTPAGPPQIFSLTPNQGGWAGGDRVLVRGVNLFNAAFTFKIGPPVLQDKQPTVFSANPDGTEVVIITPPASDTPPGPDASAIADVFVATSSGTAQLTGGFTYFTDPPPTPTPTPTATPTPPLPKVFSVNPNQGSWTGGERVVLTGENLQGGTVQFAVGPPVNASKAAQTVLVTPDGTQLVLLTPAASAAPLEQNAVVDLTVTTPVGSTLLLNGFTYLAADLVPEIYAISPNSGPISGGTRVTIAGKGFQNPVQVLFGDRQAQVVSVNYNEVIVTSPSISPSEPNTPNSVQVTVKNVRNGQISNGVPFRYGEAIFISSISPNEGPADVETLVTIFGQGFEAPVRVMVGDYETQVVSVAGTEIVARFPALPESARSCGDTGLPVEVTNINSNITAAGPDFFYRAERVLITSVTVDTGTSNIVQQYLPVNPVGAPCLTPWSSHTVTINGSGFQTIGASPAMYVRFEGVSGEFPATYVSPQQLTLTLPDLDGVNIQRVGCVLPSGATGARNVDTPVAVTVVNKRNSCTNTLPGALIIRPCDTTCRAAFPLDLILSGLGTVSVTQGATAPSICSAANCSYSVLSGTSVILSAAPASPQPGETNVLLSWSCTGDADVICDLAYPPAPSLTCGPFTMSQQTQCTVQFGPTPP